jgi:hypothetical protein
MDVLWLGCHCHSSVNTICSRIMIGLSLLSSSVNTIHILCLLTNVNDNPIITRPHIAFTDWRQQRQPSHNTTTYSVYWRKTLSDDNPIIMRPHIVFTDVLWLGCRCLPSVSTICGRLMIGLSLSSVSKHNMWSRPHIVFTDRRQQRQPNHNTTTYCVYWRTTMTTQS